MYPSCGEEEYVAGTDGIVCQGVADGVVGYHLFVLFGRDAAAQARAQVCAASGIVYHVPHFGFAHGVVAFHGEFVVRVNLD